jgi:hypothetical protein
MADGPFDGSPTYGVGSRTGVAPSISLIPVDHDPFAVTYVPVDHDPFNDSWAAGSPGDGGAFGTVSQSGSASEGSPTYGVGPSITLVPVDHDPFNDSWAAGSPFGLASPPSDQRNRCPQPWTIYLGRSREVCPPESAVRVAALWGTIEPTGFRC